MYGSQKTVAPQEFDNLYSQSGAQPLRAQIFGRLPGQMEAANTGAASAVGAARRGAAEMGSVGQFGRDVMGGRYLTSPQLDAALAKTRAASDASATEAAAGSRAALVAQQNANRAQFGRSGQTFGTANQLAQESTTAALESQLGRSETSRQAQLGATEAQAQADNYARERGFQMQAPGIVSTAASKPLEMLQAVPGLEYAGTAPAVEIIRGLASGAQVVNPNTYYKPGVGDYMLQGLGAVGAGMGAGF